MCRTSRPTEWGRLAFVCAVVALMCVMFAAAACDFDGWCERRDAQIARVLVVLFRLGTLVSLVPYTYHSDACAECRRKRAVESLPPTIRAVVRAEVNRSGRRESVLERRASATPVVPRQSFDDVEEEGGGVDYIAAEDEEKRASTTGETGSSETRECDMPQPIEREEEGVAHGSGTFV